MCERIHGSRDDAGSKLTHKVVASVETAVPPTMVAGEQLSKRE
jgi:hypothetical protein